MKTLIEPYVYLCLLAIALSFLYISINFYRNSIKKFKITPPAFTHVKLPEKIQVDNSVQQENPFMNGLKNIVTLGGHEDLKNAVFDYKEAYSRYAFQYNRSIALRKSIGDNLNEMGQLTYKILGELQKSSKLLGKNAEGLKQAQLISTNNLNTQMNNLNKVYGNYGYSDNNAVILGGALTGGLLAVGSWTLVSMLGTASTGTSIATLSGIAAHNAILAWFGGGAIAAGGGGMVAGTFTLGFIVMAPMIIYSTWKTYKKADEIRQETLKLPEVENKIKSENDQLRELNTTIYKKVEHLKRQLESVQKINDRVYKIIYPHGLRSELTRDVYKYFDKDFYTSEEASQLDELNEFIREAYELFEQMQQTSELLGLPSPQKEKK